MLIPRYWARATGPEVDVRGSRFPLELWGFSQSSLADARAAAARRVAEVAARLAAHEPGDAYLYGSRPLREEIVRAWGDEGSRGEALVSRNRYGALVLNTAQVPFVDVDLAVQGLFARLGGWFAKKPVDDPVLVRIREACRRHAGNSFRVYRTRAGYRVLATDLFLDPRADATQAFLAGFGADPCFAKLCQLQGSFRARLTPKPWRCSMPLPPGQHPREDPALAAKFAAWLARYDAASGSYATCRLVESIGRDRIASDARAVVDEHDRVSRVSLDLPLA